MESKCLTICILKEWKRLDIQQPDLREALALRNSAFCTQTHMWYGDHCLFQLRDARQGSYRILSYTDGNMMHQTLNSRSASCSCTVWPSSDGECSCRRLGLTERKNSIYGTALNVLFDLIDMTTYLHHRSQSPPNFLSQSKLILPSRYFSERVT